MLSNNRFISDEILNRYVDGQLDELEMEQMRTVISRDAAVALRLSQLREIRDLVKKAYNIK